MVTKRYHQEMLRSRTDSSVRRGNRFHQLRSAFVGQVYADHHRSKTVKQAIATVLADLPRDGIALNVGAGGTRLAPQVRNLDIHPGPNVDYVACAEALPFPDNSVDLVITQETLEHVADPFQAAREIGRVLKTGGTLYLQVPFIIGYHPGPTDFWRFTRQGIERLVEVAGLRTVELSPTVGSSTGFYRITVEYFAILFSLPARSLYLPLKAFFAAVLYPVKLLDAATRHSPQADRLAGGYCIIARKTR